MQTHRRFPNTAIPPSTTDLQPPSPTCRASERHSPSARIPRAVQPYSACQTVRNKINPPKEDSSGGGNPNTLSHAARHSECGGYCRKDGEKCLYDKLPSVFRVVHDKLNDY